MFIVLKFSGCPEQETVMDWCVENLKCRIHEEEFYLIDNITRPGYWQLLSECDDPTHRDYLKGTIRLSEKFFCQFSDY